MQLGTLGGLTQMVAQIDGRMLGICIPARLSHFDPVQGYKGLGQGTPPPPPP